MEGVNEQGSHVSLVRAPSVLGFLSIFGDGGGDGAGEGQSRGCGQAS